MPTDSELHAAVGSLALRREGKKKLTEKRVQQMISANPPFSPLPDYITPRTLAGTGETISTENAWTSISVGNGKDAAFLEVEVASTSNTDVGTLWLRDYRSNAEIDLVFVNGDEDDAQPNVALWWPLYNGTLEYKFVSSAGSPDFRIRHIGNPNV